MTRRYDPRRAVPHRSYSRADLADLFDVGISTISSWTSKGLKPMNGRRPYLFWGGEVRAFLKGHNKPRQPTGLGEIYCVACKRATQPAGAVADFFPLSPTNGNIVGRCPKCSRRIFQRVRTDEIARKFSNLTVRYEDADVPVCADAEPPRTEPSDEEES